METKKESLKLQIIFLIIGLIIGLVAGYFIFSNINLSSEQTDFKQINILNKEISNCIDLLNTCQNELDTFKETSLD